MANGSEEGKSGILDHFSNSALWAVIIAALGLGGGSGLYTAASTQDRFTASQFAAEIRSRDIEISFLKQRFAEQVTELREMQVEERRHQVEDHPPDSIKEILADHEQRLRARDL